MAWHIPSSLRIHCTSSRDSKGSTCPGRAPSFGQAFQQDRMIQSIGEWLPWIPWAPCSHCQRAECVVMLLIFSWFLPHERNTTSPCVPPLHYPGRNTNLAQSGLVTSARTLCLWLLVFCVWQSYTLKLVSSLLLCSPTSLTSPDANRVVDIPISFSSFSSSSNFYFPLTSNLGFCV